MALLAPHISPTAHSRMVVATRATAQPAPSTPQACVLLPGLDRRALQQRAQELEAAAAAAHLAAQQLNKEQHFEDAKLQYAEMRRLDREALHITRQLGCQECSAAAADDAAAAAAGDADASAGGPDSDSALFEQLHTPTPWPAPATAAGGLDMRSRAYGSVLACLTCDAAATGVQWIYDTAQLAQLLEQRRQAGAHEPHAHTGGLEFYAPVQSPFLGGYASGRNSPYGEQTLLLLQSLAAQRGLDVRAYADAYCDGYLTGFDGYMNASTVAFLRAYSRGMRPPATGADDAQADCVARLAPLLALYAGDPRLMQLVAAVTRVTQASSTAVAWAVAAAAVLERLMQGQGAAAAVRETADELRRLQHQPDGEQQQQQPLQQDTAAGRLPISGQLAAQVAAQLERVLQLARAPHAEAVEQLGRNCHLPNSAQTPLHAVLHQEWLLAQQGGGNCGGMLSLQAPADKQRVFAAAVRDALAAGGCCASRAGYAGACLGAMLGGDAVPRAWLDSYEAAGRVQELSEALCDAREAA